MIIGDFVTLEGFQEEMLGWLKDVQEKCTPDGCWWNRQKNKPEIVGFFFKIFYDPGVHDWLLEFILQTSVIVLVRKQTIHS